MIKRAAIIAVILIGLGGMGSGASAAGLDEQRLLKIQVAYILNFAKFIKWPPVLNDKEDQPFVIGVYGDNPFDGLLGGLEAKTVQGRRIETRVFTSLDQINGCKILFIGDTVPNQELLVLLDSIAAMPVVTIGTRPGFV